MRAGFFGIDIERSPATDLILDIERERLPFADGSIEYVYSSHTFEHLEAMPWLERVDALESGATAEVGV